MKKIILLGLCILFLVSLVSAATYEQNKELNLKVPCINNNTFCSSSATCNLTILYPNSSNLVYGQAMTNAGTYHNYTLTPAETKVTGEYSTTVVCEDGAENGYTTFNFKITPSGNLADEGTGSSAIAIIVFVIGLSFLFIYLAINLREEHKILSILLFLSSILVLLIGTAIISNITGTLISEVLQNRTDKLYYLIITIFIIIILYVFLYLLYLTLEYINRRKEE